jgi:hypothetical protein
MRVIFLLVLLTGGWPLARAWQVNRRTTLIQAIHWAIVAWLAWLMTLLFAEIPNGLPGVDPARYLALCLTGCAGVAVFGARRPHVGAWNFVVVGLLAVMVLPLAENILAGKESFGTIRFVFLGATVTVGILNYLPTRLWEAALAMALACAGELTVLCAADYDRDTVQVIDFLALAFLALVPWTAWGAWRREVSGSQFDRLWLAFRNRFGLVWGQRVREQFHHSARHARWPVWLSWQGLRRTAAESDPDLPTQLEMVETLKSLLGRFEDSDALGPKKTSQPAVEKRNQ